MTVPVLVGLMVLATLYGIGRHVRRGHYIMCTPHAVKMGVEELRDRPGRQMRWVIYSNQVEASMFVIDTVVHDGALLYQAGEMKVYGNHGVLVRIEKREENSY